MNIVIVLHNIRSVYNVGSIFRTADAGGVSKIYLVGVTPTPKDRLDGFRKDFSKVALGAEKTMEWEQARSFTTVYKNLKKDGFEVLAVEQDKRAIQYNKFKIPTFAKTSVGRQKSKGKIKEAKINEAKIALVFGEETKGLSKAVLDKCSQILEIPMRGKKESLNVSVAVGVVVFHLTT